MAPFVAHSAGDLLARIDNNRGMDWTPRDEPLGSRPEPVIDMATQYPNPVGTPNPRALRRRTGLIATAAAAAVVVVLAVVGLLGYAERSHLPFTDHTITVTGSFVITGGCDGLGYGDIRTGTQVVVTDEHNTTLGVGELVAAGTCRWTFTVTGVPAGRSFYGVTVSRRGTVQYTEAQLRQPLALGLGD